MIDKPIPTKTSLPVDYDRFLEALKSRVKGAQVKATLAASQELIQLYWDIGRAIVERQRRRGWGAAVIAHLSRDLQSAFPEMNGFSLPNLRRMRGFYLAYASGISKESRVVTLLGSRYSVLLRIPWGHNIELLFKLKDRALRLWYAQQALTHGWSRNVLVHQIETALHLRQGQAVTNFAATLPPPQSDLAQQAIKDPYTFDFLTLANAAKERQLESGLLDHVQQLLLELGAGFAFVGRQVPLEVEEEEFHLDLLFYHLRLRCFVVVELKSGRFKPEHAGKMGFYLAAVDAQWRQPEDRPSIGLILCQSKKRLIVEYALRDSRRPIGVAAYELTQDLPEELQGRLPSARDLERGLR